MTTLGLELGATHVRAVLAPRWGTAQECEVPWSPDDPLAMVERLRSTLTGRIGRISVAVGLAHLAVQRTALPPASAADQRRMLRLDLDRWFPLDAAPDPAVAVLPDEGLAFAMRTEALPAWVDALATLAPVHRVEPAPVALARALAARGVRDGIAVDHDAGVALTLEAGLLRAVRSHTTASPDTGKLPSHAFDAARGATLALDGSDTHTLATAAIERTIRQRTQRRTLASGVAAAAAWAVAAWAVGHARERTLRALEAEVVRVRTIAAAGQASLDRAAVLDREASAILAAHADAPDHIAALAAISMRLPATAVVQRVHVTDRTWQVEGNAVRASLVLEALASVSQFEQVRTLAPSARYQDGAGSRETYSIGFTLR